jgi:hypothetical protein
MFFEKKTHTHKVFCQKKCEEIVFVLIIEKNLNYLFFYSFNGMNFTINPHP